ncbi:MAG: hypothetical protein ABW069_04560 [Duganella sp.]
MDENIYSLLLKSAQGVALLGTLRYAIDFNAAAGAPGSDAPQQQTATGGVIFPARGTLRIPLLTGLAPVPLSGRSVYVFMGQPLLTLLSSDDQSRRLELQLNLIGFEQIAGGLVWRPGEPGQQVFSFLGRRQLPAA